MSEFCVWTPGAVEAVVLYCPKEPWSWNTVITLCGVHRAVPLPGPALVNGSLPAPYKDLKIIKDTRHVWKDEDDATRWALDNVYAKCNRTTERVATQVLHPASTEDLHARALTVLAGSQSVLCDAASSVHHLKSCGTSLRGSSAHSWWQC